MRADVVLALQLFRYLEHHGIRYVAVGDVSEFPQRIRSDLDIVVDPSMLEEADQRLRLFFKSKSAQLVQVLQHEQTAWFYVFVWEDQGGSVRFIHPDICGDYYRDGRLLLTADEILTDRIRGVGDGGQDLGFYVPMPAMAFIYYLLKRIDKADLDLGRGRYLSSQWTLDPQGAEHQIRRFWDADAMSIIEAAESNDWALVQPLLPKLRRRLRSRVGLKWSWRVGELRRIRCRLREPTGFWVAFLGPDGSGKTTVIDLVRKAVAPAFRRSRVVHLRPSVGRRATKGGPVTEPHAKPPRSWLGSISKLGYWLVDYTVGYWVQTRPAIVRSTLVLYDRYYPDILADPLRYRYNGSTNFARRLMGLIPHPDLYVLLDVPAAEAHKRKGELTIEEIKRQREVYQGLASELPNAYLVNASDPPERVARKVESLILDRMAHRELERASNPSGCR